MGENTRSYLAKHAKNCGQLWLHGKEGNGNRQPIDLAWALVGNIFSCSRVSACRAKAHAGACRVRAVSQPSGCRQRGARAGRSSQSEGRAASESHLSQVCECGWSDPLLLSIQKR